MVDILLHVTETVVTTKLICRIRKLMQNIRRLRCKNPEKRKESRGKKQDRIDSESSQHCLGRDLQIEGRENCNGSCEEESISNACGAQWDVSHPLLEQSYYLDESVRPFSRTSLGSLLRAENSATALVVPEYSSDAGLYLSSRPI
ncbi:hypothetical protein F2Q69_00057219 [Brassica cretica]|uniref:Uncharacterized protein n=1 Tax=Brassica cretica TaxID=69181 RepID=A0A8S9N4G6_BRACR|nr:hypothetical protein F2Q69_00057219 [Brassica cretica]